MLGLKKFLFKGSSAANLTDELRAALETWRESPAPAMDDVHFHTRYVVLDIACSGVNPETDKLLSIAASTVRQATILPEDAFFLDLAAQGGDIATTMETAAGTTVDQQLMAFLQFTAKAPIITYHVPYVGGFLQRTFKERLGIDFQPQWIDLALLLPALFDEKSDVVKPLDFWIDSFGLYAGNGRRSAMENTLMLARLFQMLLVRATGKEIDTAAQLVDESKASNLLRRNH
jgi:DNA polymerase-3 subunit epsilon